MPPRSHGRAPPHDHRRMHEAVWSRAEAVALLDDPARLDRENPATLWELAGLAPGMTVVDVGAGTGHFAFPASELVGAAGRVYAVDLSAELVALVRERARSRGRRNLLAVRSTPGRVPLPDEVADRVLLANVLHGIPPSTVREAVRLLRPGGQLLDVDWKKRASPAGPPVAHRLAPAEARRALEAHGLGIVRTTELGPYHYLLVAEKPEPVPAPRTPRRPR